MGLRYMRLFANTSHASHEPYVNLSWKLSSSSSTSVSFGRVAMADRSKSNGDWWEKQATASSMEQLKSNNKDRTPDIEKKFVHNVYDAIAPHFSSTRFAKWPKVAEFLGSLSHGSVVLDVGCGNGKYLGFNQNCNFIGCDISAPLVNICANKGHEVLVADAVKIPYRTGFGDAAISIAVLHHLSTEERRKRAIEELVRVVRKGGKVLITVWAVEQEDRSLVGKWTPLMKKYMEEWVGTGSHIVSNSTFSSLESIHEIGFDDKCNTETEEESIQENENSCSSTGNCSEISQSKERKDQEFFVPWHLPYHRAEVSKSCVSDIDSGFARRDDEKGSVVYNRYYHVFAQGELERLASGINSAVIVDNFYDKSNWCLVIQKT